MSMQRYDRYLGGKAEAEPEDRAHQTRPVRSMSMQRYDRYLGGKAKAEPEDRAHQTRPPRARGGDGTGPRSSAVHHSNYLRSLQELRQKYKGKARTSQVKRTLTPGGASARIRTTTKEGWDALQRKTAAKTSPRQEEDEGGRPPVGEPMDVPEEARVTVPTDETKCDLVITDAETGEAVGHGEESRGGAGDGETKSTSSPSPTDKPFIKVSGSGKGGEESKSSKDTLTQGYINGLTKLLDKVEPKALQTIDKVQQAFRDRAKADREAEEPAAPTVPGHCDPKPPYAYNIHGTAARIDGEAGMYMRGGEQNAREKEAMMSRKKVGILKTARGDQSTEERRARVGLDQILAEQVGIRSTGVAESAEERLEAAKAAIQDAQYKASGDYIIRSHELRTVEQVEADHDMQVTSDEGLGGQQRATWSNTLWRHIAKMGPCARPGAETKGDPGGDVAEEHEGGTIQIARVHGIGRRRLSLLGTGPTIEALYMEGKLIALTIDTGADRNHASPDCPAMSNVRKLEVPIVAVMANGDRTEITEQGTVKVTLVDATGSTSEHTFAVLVTEGMICDDILISCRELSRVVGQFRAEDALSGLASVCVQHQSLWDDPQFGLTAGVERRFAVTIAQNRKHGGTQGPVNDPSAVGGSYVLMAHREGCDPDEATVGRMVDEYLGKFAVESDGTPDGAEGGQHEVNARQMFQRFLGDKAGGDFFDERAEIMALPNDKVTTRADEQDELEDIMSGIPRGMWTVNPSMQEYSRRKEVTRSAVRRVRLAEGNLERTKASARDREECEDDDTAVGRWASSQRKEEVIRLTRALGDRERTAARAANAESEALAAINAYTEERMPPRLMRDGIYHPGDKVTVTCDGGAGEHAGRRGAIIRRTEDMQVSYMIDFGINSKGEHTIGRVYENELRAHFDPLGETGYASTSQTVRRRPAPTAPAMKKGDEVIIRNIRDEKGAHLNGQTVRVHKVGPEGVCIVDRGGGKWRVMMNRIERTPAGGSLPSEAVTSVTALPEPQSILALPEPKPSLANLRTVDQGGKVGGGGGVGDADWTPSPGQYVDVDGERGVLYSEAAGSDGAMGDFTVKVPGREPFTCPMDELVQWKGRRIRGVSPGEQYHLWPPQLNQVVSLGHPSEEEQRIVMITDLGEGGEVGYDSRVTVVNALGQVDTAGLDDLSPCPGAAVSEAAADVFRNVIAKAKDDAAHDKGQDIEGKDAHKGGDPGGQSGPAEECDGGDPVGGMISTFEPLVGDFAVRRGESVKVVAIDRGAVPWAYTVALADGREVHTELSNLAPPVTTRAEGALYGDRSEPTDETIQWPPGAHQYVQHCQRTSIVLGRSSGVHGDETVFRIKRVADGVETQDVKLCDLRPCLHDPDDVGMDRRPTSLAPGLRKGSKKMHPRVGGTRWVVNTLLSAYTLHLMFGHAGYDRVKRTLGATFGAQVKGKWPCEGCQDTCEGCRANTKRRKFLKKRIAVRSTQPMVEISMDHPGVLRGAGRGLPQSITGGKVPHVSVCSGSSYVFVHKLEDFSGGQVAVVVTDIIDFCHGIGIARVPRWLTDGAMCYVGGPVPKLIASLGGTMEYTNASSSNGNAKVERIIGSLYGMARAMLAHSKLPMCFWFEALAWAAKLHNCMAGTDSTVTPHELVHGRPPVIDDMLHVFGSAMTVTDVTTVRKSPVKLGPTSTKAYFTGTPLKQRGVRGVAPTARGPGNNKVTAMVTSRDAFVHELLKPRMQTPVELQGLLGPVEAEERGMRNLRHTPHHIPPMRAVGKAGGMIDELPTELYGEPRRAKASAMFDGQPVMAIDPTGRENRWGHMRGATTNRQDDGGVILDEEHPARIVYNVLWEDGVEQFLTWPEVQPFLVQGLTEPERSIQPGQGMPRGENEWTCSNGHRAYGETVQAHTSDVIECDTCGTEIRSGETSITCSQGGCDWDQCMACAQATATGNKSNEEGGFMERTLDAEEEAAERRAQLVAERDRRDAIDEANAAQGRNEDHDPDADDDAKYSVGDHVNARYDGRWYNAKVIGVTGEGDLTIQYRDKTQQRVDAARTASDLRLPPGPATAAARTVRLRRCEARRARVGRALRDKDTAARIDNIETCARVTHCTPRKPVSIDSRMRRAQGQDPARTTKTRSATSNQATPGRGSRGGASDVVGQGVDSESKSDGLEDRKARRPPKMPTEKQEQAFNMTEHLRFAEGDTITAMADAKHNLDNPGWLILRRGERGDSEGDRRARRKTHETATGPTWAAWMPIALDGLTGDRKPGTAEAISDGTGKGVIWITTNRDDTKTTAIERAESWKEGLNAIERAGVNLQRATFYMALGIGMGIRGKTWWRDYLPEIGRFAIRLGESQETSTVIMRKGKEKIEWFEEDKRRNWATKDDQWDELLLALGDGAQGGGAYDQSDRKGRPGLETTLRAIEAGSDLFDVTAGITDPSSVDGVYEAEVGPLTDTDIDGLREGFFDVDPAQCGGDRSRVGAKGRFPQNSVRNRPDPGGITGGGGLVGAPVRFARSAEEHESIRATRTGRHEAQCLFIDPIPRKELDENGRIQTEVNRRRDEMARRRELKRLATVIEREEDTAAVLAGSVLTEGGSRPGRGRSEKGVKGGQANGRPPEESSERSRTKASAVRGTRIRSSWAMVRAWRVCLTSQESVEMLLRPDEAEPTVRDALSGPMRYVWLHACLSEVLTQLHQGTFRVVRRDETLAKDPGCNIMQSGMRLLVKWGYCDPLGEHGPTRFKARFIAGGDTQIRGVDYMYTSSPTPRPASIRWLFGKAADPGWKVYSTDVSGAFCISPAEYDNMYMECPRFFAPDDQGVEYPDGLPPRERFRRRGRVGDGEVPDGYCERWDPLGAAGRSRSNARRRKPNFSDFILHLLTQCYGTKQASMLWYRLWSQWVKDHGFKRSDGDECLWYRRNQETGSLLVIATHVDDTLCLTNDPSEYAKFVAEMKASFECTDEEEVQYFLGIRVQSDQEENTVVLSQEALSDAIVTEAQAAGCILADTPMIDSQYLVTGGEWEQIDPTVEGGGMDMTSWELRDPEPNISNMERRAVALYPYRRILGMMIHLTTWTRPELAFVVSNLAKYSDPCRCRWTHVQAMARVVAYIAGTRKLGLRYVGNASEDPGMVAWVDADHAGNPSTRLSVTGFVIHCRGAAIQWQSGRQKIVAQSSFESELIASRAVTAEMMALAKDYATIEQRPLPTPFKIGCDNMAVCAVSEGAGKYSKRKFIAIRYFLIRRAVRQGLMILCSVPTDWNVADLFTKSLGWDKFRRFRDKTMNVARREVEDGENWLVAG